MARKEPEPVKLTDKEAEELRQADQDALLVKAQIADLTEQIIIAEDNRRKMFDQLYAKQAAYRGRTIKMGTRHGIDFDLDPQVTGFKWGFDHKTMTWTPEKVEGVDPQADLADEFADEEKSKKPGKKKLAVVEDK
jgi:hypothetical protein